MMNKLNKFFKISQRKTTLKTELVAGISTFLAMIYIVILNPDILATAGMDKGSVFIATILAIAMSTILMGIYANIPLVLAPGMGLSVFITYVVVLRLGLPWQIALFTVFCSGVLLLIVSLAPVFVRKKILGSIPKALTIGIGMGIGLFLILIGLQNSGALVPDHKLYFEVQVALGNIKDPKIFLSLLGFFVILILETKKIKGSFIISIVLITLLSFIFTDNTYEGVIGLIPPYHTFFALDFVFPQLIDSTFVVIVLTLLFVEFFDNADTIKMVARPLVSENRIIQRDEMSKETEMMIHAQGNKSNQIALSKIAVPLSEQMRKSNKPMIVTAIATILGSILGTANTTIFVESSVGVSRGGRTGLSAITTGVLFLLCLFFFPFVKSIPSYALAPILIYVGLEFFVYNIRLCALINHMNELIPMATATMVIPLTSSISYGIIFSFLAYIIISIIEGKIKKVHPIVWIISILSALYLIFS